MEIKIRRAVKEDCARLMELVQELADYEKAPDQVTVTLNHFQESGFGPNPVWWAFVAEADGIVQGFALYYVRYSTWKGCRMYLEDLIITESWRGKGIGKLLFNQLINEARELGFNGMTWQVLDWNKRAIKFYETLDARIEPEWWDCKMDEDQIRKYK